MLVGVGEEVEASYCHESDCFAFGLLVEDGFGVFVDVLACVYVVLGAVAVMEGGAVEVVYAEIYPAGDTIIFA